MRGLCDASVWLFSVFIPGMSIFPLAQEVVHGTGFLGTRGSIMLDVVFLAMFAVLPILTYGIYLAKQGRYAQHKRVQLVLGSILLLAVLAFEVDMRLFTEWEKLATPSPYFDAENPWGSPVGLSLIIHLCFAVPTLFLWIFVIVRALRKFPSPPQPSSHSSSHRFWGMIAAGGMFLTAATGVAFYFLAFVATKEAI